MGRLNVLSLPPSVSVPWFNLHEHDSNKMDIDLMNWRALRQTGDNLKVVWTEFSTLS